MLNLEKYLFKNVLIKDTNDNIHKGYVDLYENELDSGYGEPSIGILPNKDAKDGIELVLSEIKSIEFI
ncbi:MAG: hypothetical protein LUH47_05405 [Clostridiales bacterium]|nr:hypothetical protein [Clostridiales bacterium]